MKKYLTLIILSLCVFTLSAQSYFIEGYIVDNDGATINGLIDFRSNANLAHECHFKSSPDAEVIRYQPGEIKEFMFVGENKKYVSHTVQLDGKDETLFLEFLVQGVKNLYYYKGKLDKEYYFIEGDQGQLVSMTKGEAKIDGIKIKEDQSYKGILNYILQDGDKLIKETQNTKFTRKSMINIVKKYHDTVCTTGEECIVFENDYKKEEYSKVKFSVFAGMQLNKYHLQYNRKKIDMSDNSFSPIIGAQMNVFAPRAYRAFSFQAEVSISRIAAKSGQISTWATEYKNKTVYDFTSMLFTYRLGPKYTYLEGKWRPTVELGIGQNFYLGKSIKESMYKEEEYPHLDLDFSNFFIYGALGVDYQLPNDSFVFIRLEYDFGMWHKRGHDVEGYIGGRQKLSSTIIKLGYTF